MPSIKQGFQLVKNMGLRYTTYRIGLVLEKRMGIYEKKFPINPPLETFISLSEWRKAENFWGIKQSDTLDTDVPDKLPDFGVYQSGVFPFFSSDTLDLGNDYDWITNPDTGHQYQADLHWSKIQDYSQEAGDIKFVWEKSRFAYLYDVIRHDYYTKEDHSKWVFNEIESWLDANAINCGPNYKCSQEISLRVLNWTYALNYYRDSKCLTEVLFDRIMHSIYWQLKHVYSNINFSRIAVRNNHAITETLTLYLASIFYPFFPEASVWKKDGKKWFEQEIEYQVYADGTFLQFSMNYHRVVIQLMTWAIKTAECSGDVFKDVVYQRAYESLRFLYTCQNAKTGALPNYGNNDGALFFKLNSCDYRDYRPQLNALHVLLTGENLYKKGEWSEDLLWFDLPADSKARYGKLTLNPGWHSFPIGGFYILLEDETLTFIRCGNHKDRPAQADNLHLDIWYKGENILFDGGTYKYNTDPKLLKYFMGTESHNTVMIDHYDQMEKGSRFIWFNWTQALSASCMDNSNDFTFTGEISAFTYLNSKISHKRFIRKLKGQLTWIIEDSLNQKPSELSMKQYWHALPDTVIESTDQHSNSLTLTREDGLRSDYYGKKQHANQFVAETKSNFIKTTIKL